MTITEFLLARIAEDEGAAQYEPVDLQPWVERGEGVDARVLAECEAKRRIVETVDPAVIEFWMAQDLGNAGPLLETWQIRTLRALSSVYADHPDYRQEWA